MKKKPIIIEDYNPEWENEFNLLKRALVEHIYDNLIVEHVGSTSVKGLAAKSIIDIDIIIKSMKDLDDLAEKLESLGYISQGTMGIEGRYAFQRALNDTPLLKEHHSKWHAHHLYVCIEGCLALENHLLIRDYLRTHEESVKEYSELKKSLALKYPYDMDTYIEKKSPFLLKILKESGLSDEKLNVIEGVNKKN